MTQIHLIYAIYGSKSSSKKYSVSIDEWLAAASFVKYCTLKRLFPAINYKEKIFFRNNYSSLDHSLFL